MTETQAGLRGSLRRLLATLLAIASTRLELLVNEVHEERLHWGQMLLYFFAALFCLGMAALLLTLLVVVLFWDSHRLVVLGGMGAAFLFIGLLLAARLRALSRRKSTLFAASLAELQQDRQQLEGQDVEP